MLQKVYSTFKIWGFWEGLETLLSAMVYRLSPDKWGKKANENLRIRKINDNGFSILNKGKYWKISDTHNKLQIFCRKYSGDLDIFNQIFVQQEYKDLMTSIKNEKIEVETIIDAGGNIGLASVLFSTAYPNAAYTVLEPDKQNCEVLKQNLSINKINARVLEIGLWKTTRRLYFDTSFRGGKEYSISLTEEPKSKEYVDAISMNDLVEKYRLAKIDLLKMDIEGAERYIFDEEADLDFLNRTRVICIEIHDEFDARERIIRCLTEKNFAISVSGEYLVGIHHLN